MLKISEVRDFQAYELGFERDLTVVEDIEVIHRASGQRIGVVRSAKLAKVKRWILDSDDLTFPGVRQSDSEFAQLEEIKWESGPTYDPDSASSGSFCLRFRKGNAESLWQIKSVANIDGPWEIARIPSKNLK